MRTIRPLASRKALIVVPADKSISHRALLVSSLAAGTTMIDNLLYSEDTIATLDAVQKLGVRVVRDQKVAVTGCHGVYPRGNCSLDLHESGTSLRLLAGILSAQKYAYVLKAEPSLQKRPMGRVTVPLRSMGARIQGRMTGQEEYPPLSIEPVAGLKGIDYRLPVQSAQVKSAILFASLSAAGKTVITEMVPTRDHTERMLSIFGAKISRKGDRIMIARSALKNVPYLFVPGDISSAAFFCVLGLLLRNSEIFMEKIGINPTRTGLLNVLKRMGGSIKIVNANHDYFEPYADILVTSSRLKACTVTPREIPSLIDELPILFLCAARAEGTSLFKGIEELRVKEADRIRSMLYNLQQCGVRCGSKREGMSETVFIEGTKRFNKKARFKSFGDHRTAMSCVVAGLLAEKPVTIDDTGCINKSFPEFMDIVQALYAL